MSDFSRAVPEARLPSSLPTRGKIRRLTAVRLVSLGAVVVALSPLASCRQVLGIKERKLAETADAGTSNVDTASSVTKCGGFKQSSTGCKTCLDSECCDAATACEADPECKPTYECMRECAPGDADCVAVCVGSYARPDTLAALLSCTSSACSKECGLGCGALTDGSSSCDACVQAQCCTENTACSGDADCVEVEFCNERCLPTGSTPCTTACTDQHPDGATEYAARAACVTSSCADECSSDRAWACLDHPRAWKKPPTLDPLTFSMTVVEFLSEAPYVGLTVKACSQADLACQSPEATATTDDAGLFSMTVPSGASGFNGYLDLSGAGIYPALYYLLPPLVVGGFRGRLRLPAITTLDLLAGAMMVTLDPARGHLALVPWDCTLSPAAGVSFQVESADSKSTAYYFRQGTPSTKATETETTPAIGGAVNVPAGFALVRANVVGTGQKSAELNFNVRAGTLTTAPIPPSP